MKKVFAMLLIFAIEFSVLFANPAAINFANLPKDKSFENLLLDFGNAYDSIRYPDFTHKKEKKSALKSAKKLHSFLKKQKNANYDEQLLSLLSARCLYNFDEIDFGKVSEEFDSINSEFSEKAEHHWIYGNLLVTAGKVIEGKAELEKYMQMKNYYIGSLFVEDYAYSFLMCGMPFHALHSITNGGTIPEGQIKNQSLLALIKNNIKESSADENYETGQVWKISGSDGEYNYVYSTMLGISFPCKSAWKLRLNSFSATNPAVCMLGVDDFTLEEQEIGISVLIMAYPDSIYSDSVKKNLLEKFPIIKTETEEISHKKFEKYTYEDLTKYNDARKGSRGYLYFASIEPGKWAGAKCEHEIDLSKISADSGKTKFYAISPSQNRLQEKANIVILVDSCNALSKETDKLLEDLFEKAVFD